MNKNPRLAQTQICLVSADVRHFAFIIHSLPEIMLDPVDLHEHLIEVPLGMQAQVR